MTDHLVLADEWLSIYAGDCRDVLAQLPAGSVHCVVTSPPYYGLRDYGLEPSVWEAQADPSLRAKGHEHEWTVGRCICGAWHGQFGLEPSPDEYVAHLVEVFRAVWRVLRDDGTAWLNLGDSFAGSGKGYGGPAGAKQQTNAGSIGIYEAHGRPPTAAAIGLKPKDLIGIPWRAAFALQADGWHLRRDIVWDKPNPMPESIRDRPTSSHEYVFLLAKAERYYFDVEAVREPAVTSEWPGIGPQHGEVRDRREAYRPMQVRKSAPKGAFNGKHGDAAFRAIVPARNIRSVWRIPTVPYPEAHFVTFPPELPTRCIMAGTSERGVCPECGAPWRRSGQSDWRPGCAHGTDTDAPVELEHDDLEVIASPVGGRNPNGHPKPGRRGRLDTVRRGLDRPRGNGEGIRPITRFEQRRYAEQLRALDAEEREALIRRFGAEAWAHYTRKDRAGARPLPAAALADLLDRGVLEYVPPPAWSALAPVAAVVLDPFAGSGTVGMVAQLLSRRAVLIDKQPEYVRQQMRRAGQAPLGL